MYLSGPKQLEKVRMLTSIIVSCTGKRCSAAEALLDDWFTSDPVPMTHVELCHNIQKTVAAKQAWLASGHQGT